MFQAITKITNRLTFTEFIYLLFLVSLICAFRAVTSICTGLILAIAVSRTRPFLRLAWMNKPEYQFTAACILFFLLQLVALFYTHNRPAEWEDIRLKSGLFFLPFAFLCIRPLHKESHEKMLLSYCFLLFVACFFLLCMALNTYQQVNSISVFFYHNLVRPFNYHAVYFSILVFTALAFLIENAIRLRYLLDKQLLAFLIAFFSLFLLLLSSKLVISFYILYVIYIFLSTCQKKRANLLFTGAFIPVLLCLCSLLFLTRNPVSVRFRDILHGNPSLAGQESFSPSVYFNGVQFRLLQWKLVPAILSKNHGWWTGVSSGDAQTLLNQEYRHRNMYTGETGREGHGYLDYNTHSQFLEALLQNGIPGAIVFLLICLALVRMILQTNNRLAVCVIILLLLYSLIESLFEEQYGIVLFTFLPFFTNRQIKTKPHPVQKENVIM